MLALPNFPTSTLGNEMGQNISVFRIPEEPGADELGFFCWVFNFVAIYFLKASMIGLKRYGGKGFLAAGAMELVTEPIVISGLAGII